MDHYTDHRDILIRRCDDPTFTYRFIDQQGDVSQEGFIEMVPLESDVGWRNKEPLFCDFSTRRTNWMVFDLEIFMNGVLQRTFSISTLGKEETLYQMILEHDCVRVNSAGEVYAKIVGHSVREGETHYGDMFTKIELHEPRPIKYEK